MKQLIFFIIRLQDTFSVIYTRWRVTADYRRRTCRGRRRIRFCDVASRVRPSIARRSQPVSSRLPPDYVLIN